jgi:hypothetical protein
MSPSLLLPYLLSSFEVGNSGFTLYAARDMAKFILPLTAALCLSLASAQQVFRLSLHRPESC